MSKHLFVVRSTVPDPEQRDAFDAWYHNEHVPDAMKAFGAERAWRYWSIADPTVHLAMYQFPDRVSLDRAMAESVMKPLVADFDRAWPGIKRTRDLLALAETAGTAD